MNISQAKENILRNIREALSETTPLPFSQSEGNSLLFQKPHDDFAVIFAEEFGKLQGQFAYCETEAELTQLVRTLTTQLNIQKLFFANDQFEAILRNNGFEQPAYLSLNDCDAAITGCEMLVARTGTIVLSSAAKKGRTASVYAPVHICIAFTNQLVYDTRDALLQLKEKYPGDLPSMVTFASGPSRTADIEKTLVKGIHGPAAVYCILLENNNA
jgi:L-lactate dehydrogenase complex protein LldG